SANKAKKRRKRKRGRKVFARDSQGRILDMRNGADAAPKPAEPNSIGIAGAGGARPQRRSGTPNAADAPAYAALDLGTNNCRLLVAIPTRPGHFRVVDAFSRIVRLGEGLSASGRLGDAAMNRAVDALKVCADKLAGRKLRRMRLIATEACR